jgi:nitroreductase
MLEDLTRKNGSCRSDWPGPQERERPSAYITILGDTAISHNFACDVGIAGRSIFLGAREQGLAGRIISDIDRKKLKSIFDLPTDLEIFLALAIGKPKEKIVLENLGPDRDIKNCRDDNKTHHVPKRSLNDIM